MMRHSWSAPAIFLCLTLGTEGPLLCRALIELLNIEEFAKEEDGIELTAPADSAIQLWETLMSAGAESGIMAAGLGCRDTLRLEAAMPLYGHELSEDIDPLTAGLNFAVKLDAADFVGGALPFGTINFADSDDVPKTITIDVAGDSDLESDERFTVALSNPTGGATIVTGTASGEIQDDDVL